MTKPLTLPPMYLWRKDGWWFLGSEDGDPSSAHETRIQAEAWFRYVNSTNGYERELIERG